MHHANHESPASEASGAQPPGGGGSASANRHREIGELLFHNPRTRRMAAKLLLAAVGVALAIVGLFLTTDLEWSDVTGLIDWPAITTAIDRLEPALVIPAMAILPIFGFPVSVVYLVAGARFGPVWGGAVVGVATAVHLLGSYAIARSVLRRPLLRFIERRHRRLPQIPEDEQASVALVVALVPGLPYVVRIYLLAIADFRLRIYFWVCLGVYVLRSYVTILMGDLSTEPSGRRLAILLGMDALKILICAFVIWRLRVHHRRYHAADVPAATDGSGVPKR